MRQPHGTMAPAKGTTAVERRTAARESKDLDTYLKEGPSGVKVGPRMQSNESAFKDENWNDEPSFSTLLLIRSKVVIPDSTRKRPCKVNANRYNPRRQLQRDDVQCGSRLKA